MISHHHPPSPRCVRFNLPTNHSNKDSTHWRRRPCQPRKDVTIHNIALQRNIKEAVLSDAIPLAISNTGATSHALLPLAPLIPTGEWSQAVFHLPIGTTAAAATINKLHLNVRKPARSANIVPALVENSLLSTNKFVEAGYTVIYDAEEVNLYGARTTKIVVSEVAILKGWRCPRAKLWCVPITKVVTNENTDTLLLAHSHGHDSINAMYQVKMTTVTRNHIRCMCCHASKEHIHNVYELPSIKPSIRYLHGAAGFPTKPSWLKAIRRGNHNSWPLINVKNVAKYFPELEETQKVHMQGQCQGVWSTKRTESTLANDNKDLDAPSHDSKRDVLITVYNLRSMMYTDQTEKFPHISSLGNQYIMILHNVDSSSSWVKAIMNNTKGKLILAQQHALACMKQCGIVPTHQILDNQASAAYKTAIETSKMMYQLIPPNNHQQNMAEKAIQTFKNHFVSVLSRCAPTMPMYLWCQLLPQVELQLLLLRQSRVNPNMSAYAHLYGQHDCNKHPFVPIGMEALVHDKPHKQQTFAEHCRKAFVLGTSTKHY
jgi:hypothetical protein